MPGFHENERAILESIALASGGLSHTVKPKLDRFIGSLREITRTT